MTIKKNKYKRMIIVLVEKIYGLGFPGYQYFTKFKREDAIGSLVQYEMSLNGGRKSNTE